MIIRFQHSEGSAALEVSENGSSRVSVDMRNTAAFCSCRECETGYSKALVELILKVKGPDYLCDEIRRDEDPSYVQDRLEREVGFYTDLRALDGKRILDFGCGGGASTFCLARLVKDADIVGVELDPELLSIADGRKRFYEERRGEDPLTPASSSPSPQPSPLKGEGADKSARDSILLPLPAGESVSSKSGGRQFLSRNLRFLLSPSATTLPPEIGSFDFIVLSAVYEHLLPAERQPVLAALWAVLRPGGILFINQTPNRWFPVEQHTTGLPLLNYAPDGLALFLARHCSRRKLEVDDWPTLLRKGIRGGSELRIMTELGQSDVEPLCPARLGANDSCELWLKMSSPRWMLLKRIACALFKVVKRLTGLSIVPAFIVMAVRKRKG